MNKDMLVLPTCEISYDPETAIEIGKGWGLKNFELKLLWDNIRVPFITPKQKEYLKGVVKDYGVRIVTVSPGLFLGVDPTEEKAKYEIEEKLPRSIEFAKELDCSRLIVMAFNKKPGIGEEFAIEKLAKVAGIAKAAGMALVIEPVIGNYADSGQSLRRIVLGVGSDVLRANWDPGNVQQAGFNAFPDEYNHIKDLIGYVHLKNWNPAAKRFSLFHTGAVDLKANLAQLKRDGYKGHLAIETHTRWHRDQELPIAASKKNYDTLVKWLGEI